MSPFSSSRDPRELRHAIAQAHLMLIFSPELCRHREPLETLESVLEWIDVIQIRPKSAGGRGPSSAREVHDWCVRVLDMLASHPRLSLPVIVNDRVDVAAALWPSGCAGVHVGQDDCPVDDAREFLGPDPLIGVSTHDVHQIVAAGDGADYLGFGPINATHTKGYELGLGAEAGWVASIAASQAIFPIGGIDATNIGELTRIGKAAVGSAILAASDPPQAARELRALLAP